jgi:NAD(P)-dependent dehydrogenase (short-subunit alcohol dehydrogenase family)
MTTPILTSESHSPHKQRRHSPNPPIADRFPHFLQQHLKHKRNLNCAPNHRLLPLLHASTLPYGAKVINISSARGSLTRSTAGDLPPTQAVAYSISKTALNALTIEFQKAEDARVAGLGMQSWEARDRRVRFFLRRVRGILGRRLMGFGGVRSRGRGRRWW